MSKRRHQTVADYAAIGLAPVLIFVMLSSLALFLMMVLYSGYYPARVTQTLLFYTMGVTAIARMTIEEGRNYSAGYTFALGAASLFVMNRFFGGPFSSAIVLIVIGYLADRIVHDCTIVDDAVDSSGQGLIDRGRSWFQKQKGTANENNVPSTQEKGSQPGKTVLYLAVGALPLFGIGQFFLRGQGAAWSAARILLAIYLFSSLSLLVVTAFLNLRRYLRQRNTEMPWPTTVAWLAGGMGMIAVVLLLSLLAPLPGRTMASFRMPEFLKNTTPIKASPYGYGDEGAEDSGDGSDSTSQPPPNQPAPDLKSQSSQPGSAEGGQASKPGGESGNRKDAPPGKDPGGQKGKSKAKGEESSKPPQSTKQGDPSQPNHSQKSAKPSEASKKTPSSQEPQSQPKKPSDQPKSDQPKSKGGETPKSKAADQKIGNSSESSNEQPKSSEQDKPSETSQPPSQPPADSNKDSNKSKTSQSNESAKTSEQSESKEQAEPNEQDETNKQSEPNEQAKPRDSTSPQTQPKPQPTPPASSTDWGGMLSGVVSLLKYLVMFLLLAIVAAYVFLNLNAILAWIDEWLGGREVERTPANVEKRRSVSTEVPARKFASFENPIGRAEPRQIIVITFQALEAWAGEQGVRRNDHETPSEFVQRLATQFPGLKKSAVKIVDAYNRIVYGQDNADQNDVQAADQVWNFMRPQL